MQPIKWSPELSFGIKDMDAAHKEFFENLTELLTLPDEQFAAAFMQLVGKVEKDFREEEDLMEEIDYPGLPGHREQHAKVLGALHHIAPHVMGGDIGLGREAAELLPQWFLFHLSTMDTALAFALDLDGEEVSSVAIRLAAQRIRQGTDRSI